MGRQNYDPQDHAGIAASRGKNYHCNDLFGIFESVSVISYLQFMYYFSMGRPSYKLKKLVHHHYLLFQLFPQCFFGTLDVCTPTCLFVFQLQLLYILFM